MKVDIFNTDKKYNIIYADPPWSYNASSKNGTSKGVAERHYDTMSADEIKALPVGNLGDNAVLFMWATFPCLPQAIETIKAWGFTYKTVAFNWTKISTKTGNAVMGCGYWTRANGEICLLATKGKEYPRRICAGVQQAIIEPRREHSRKPDVARDRIVQLLGDLPRIELFARQHADGWDCWGNEAPDIANVC